MSAQSKHILVIRLSAMGDVAMTVPVIRALTQQHPEVKITVLTRAFFEPFFRNTPNVSVYKADVKGAHKGILGLFKLSRELKKLNIDAVADLHNVLRSKLLKFFLFGTRVVQIDKGRAEKKALTTGQTFKQLKTTHQRYAAVFNALGFTIDLSSPKFPQKVNLSTSDLNNYVKDQERIIGIAPFAAFKSKTYPIEQMEEVIAKLSETSMVLLFGGGEKETNILTGISQKYSNVVSLAGKLSLNEELDIISNLSLMIAMDSGNAHIAAMLGVNVLSIWGVTHPYAGFYPFGQDSNNALLADRNKYPLIPTSIYGNTFPENYELAIASISPQSIVNKVEDILKKSLAQGKAR